MKGWLSRITAGVLTVAISRGIVLGFGLDRWIAGLIQQTRSSAPVEALAWLVSGICGLLILISWPRIVEAGERFLAPFKLTAPFVHDIQDREIMQIANPRSWDAKYLKAGIISKKKLTDVQVRIVGLSHTVGERTTLQKQFDPILLGWASTPDCSKSVDIPQGIERQYDILKINELSQWLHFCHGVLRANDLENYFRQAGVYRIELAISANEIKTTRHAVEVAWNGDWKAVEIWQA